MTRRQMVCTLIGVLVIQVAVATATAGADGLPVLGIAAGTPAVSTPDGQLRYRARPTGRDTSLQVRSASGRLVSSARLPGRLAIPVVAYDGSPAGLSANGSTLVLLRPRVTFPQPATHLMLLDARTLRVRSSLRLRGDFSFDAISPSGRWIYLIQYTSRVDPTRYRVRALDARTQRFLGRDIVDPHNRHEAMRGNPLTRAVGPGQRWAYTLYDGNGHPFVHALDTTALTARCIDVPAFPATNDPWSARLALSPDGTRLMVTMDHRTLTTIDTTRMSVIRDTRVNQRRPAPEPARSAGGSLSTAAVVVAAFVLLAAGLLGLRRRVTPLSRPVDAP